MRRGWSKSWRVASNSTRFAESAKLSRELFYHSAQGYIYNSHQAQALHTRLTSKRRHTCPVQTRKALSKRILVILCRNPSRLADDVLFGDVWERKELSPRDRSLITVAALITGGNTEQLSFHLNKAKENGLTETDLKEVITHLAFYAGWPRAMSALTVAKRVFEGES